MKTNKDDACVGWRSPLKYPKPAFFPLNNSAGSSPELTLSLSGMDNIMMTAPLFKHLKIVSGHLNSVRGGKKKPPLKSQSLPLRV